MYYVVSMWIRTYIQNFEFSVSTTLNISQTLRNNRKTYMTYPDNLINSCACFYKVHFFLKANLCSFTSMYFVVVQQYTFRSWFSTYWIVQGKANKPENKIGCKSFGNTPVQYYSCDGGSGSSGPVGRASNLQLKAVRFRLTAG